MKKRNLTIVAGIIFVTIGLYALLWSAPPLSWDDDANIFANPYFVMHQWWRVWLEPYYGLYVPVISTVWAALYWLGGGASTPFRILNTLIHVGNIFLLFWLLRGLAARWKLRNPLVPSLALAIFAFHPLQVETVAWISGGRDLLATCFALAATLLYFSRPSRAGFWGATSLFLLALLAKPSVVALPLVLVLYDEGSLKPKLWKFLPWFLLAGGAVGLTQFAQVEHFINGVAWWQRPLIMLDTYKFYFLKVMWPHPLSGNYGRTPESVVADIVTCGMAVVFGLTMIGAFMLARFASRRWLLMGAWFLILLPVSGVVPFAFANISCVADHYNYPAMAVVAMLFMLALDLVWPKPEYTLLPLALMGAWCWASVERLPVWGSNRDFFTDMARTAPASYSAALGMSIALCAEGTEYAEGVEWTDKALAARPNDISALANRAYCLLRMGRNQDVIAMDSYFDALDPDKLEAEQPTGYSSFLASLGTALVQEQDLEMGYQFLCEAVRVKPSEVNHQRNLQVATEILSQHGLTPHCEENSVTEPVDERLELEEE